MAARLTTAISTKVRSRRGPSSHSRPRVIAYPCHIHPPPLDESWGYPTSVRSSGLGLASAYVVAALAVAAAAAVGRRVRR